MKHDPDPVALPCTFVYPLEGHYLAVYSGPADRDLRTTYPEGTTVIFRQQFALFTRFAPSETIDGNYAEDEWTEWVLVVAAIPSEET